MICVTFHNQRKIPDQLLKFAVIAAKYNGMWIFCRHKSRTTWEIPGGHREIGESIPGTAKRELYEETGAARFDIKPICVYGVTKDEETTYGMLYYSEIKELGELPPEMKIGEIKLFDTLPSELTYPAIQPYLFEHIQGWLNLQSSPNEIWDVYDENRKLTGRTHRRGDPLAKGDYHLVVHVWIKKRNGEFLLTKRTPNKGFGNMWECTGGSALAGDDSITAALREVKEETGLTVQAENGECILTLKRNDAFVDIWLFRQDFDLNDVVFQPNETCDAMQATEAQIRAMSEKKTLVPFSYLDDFLRRAAVANIAYCGLACCVCSENDKCIGCQSGGCDIHGWCKNYNCCRKKGLNGCWECDDFPCQGGMLDKLRIRAFARFAKKYGTDEMTKCLFCNKENGVVYHYDGQLIGDYDKCENEKEIIEMIKTGKKHK